MKTDPLVSIVIPAYNHGAYLDAAIRSILDQDYPHVELIVIDDGWAAARNWKQHQDMIGELIDKAGRNGQSVILLPTAPSVDGCKQTNGTPVHAQ